MSSQSMEVEQKFVFKGFISPDRGGTFFYMPTDYIDLLPRLKGALHTVATYFFRHNWGFHEYRRMLRLSFDELMHGRLDSDGLRMDTGTGLSERAIRTALKKLVEMGILIAKMVKGPFGPVEVYGIHIQDEEEEKQPDEEHRQNLPPLSSDQSDPSSFCPKAPAKFAAPPAKSIAAPAKKSEPSANFAATIEERKEEIYKGNKHGKKDSVLSHNRSVSFPLLSLKMDFEKLRNAPWDEETILALASKVLPVPDGEAIRASGNKQAIEQWYSDWFKPAEHLLRKTAGLSPVQAWLQIDRVIRYMVTPGSPSWWQHRKTDSPIVLKHVANNYGLQLSKAIEHDWLPIEVTLYDGPIYETGYTGTEQEQPQENVFYSQPAKTSTIEVVAQPGEDRKKTQPLRPEQASDTPPDDTPPSGPPRGGKRRPSSTLPQGLPSQVAMAIEACQRSQERQDRERSQDTVVGSDLTKKLRDGINQPVEPVQGMPEVDFARPNEKEGEKPMGMSEEERDRLIKLMREHEPSLYLSTYTTDAGLHVVSMAHEDGDDGWWDVLGGVKEWNFLLKKHPEVVEKAVEYGRQSACVVGQPEPSSTEPAVIQALPEPEAELSSEKEEPVYPIGMTERELQGLIDEVLVKYPAFQYKRVPLPDGSYALQVHDGPDTTFKIWQSWQWRQPSSKELIGRIIKAKVYAREQTKAGIA